MKEIAKNLQAKKQLFMQKAIDLSIESVRNGGGPFGAVIVKDGEIVAAQSNHVTQHNDPTAHAEVCTIRAACQKLETFDLTGCEIYTSCEPCPMCLGAIYWAHLDKVYYANTRNDARETGFDDDLIYNEIARPIEGRQIPFEQISRAEALEAFEEWKKLEGKVDY